MRAVLCQEWGGPEKLVVSDVCPRHYGKAQCASASTMPGVNFADLLLIARQSPLEAGDGQPSRWNTLRAWRVLGWYEPSVADLRASFAQSCWYR